MRKMLAVSALVLLGVTMTGCGICDGLRRGSMTQPWNAPMSCCDTCTTCEPEAPCGVCESCTSGTTMSTITNKAPTMLPGPN